MGDSTLKEEYVDFFQKIKDKIRFIHSRKCKTLANNSYFSD